MGDNISQTFQKNVPYRSYQIFMCIRSYLSCSDDKPLTSMRKTFQKSVPDEEIERLLNLSKTCTRYETRELVFLHGYSIPVFSCPSVLIGFIGTPASIHRQTFQKDVPRILTETSYQHFTSTGCHRWKPFKESYYEIDRPKVINAS